MAVKIWEMMTTIENGEYLIGLMNAHPPMLDVVNLEQIHRYFHRADIEFAKTGRYSNPLYYKEMPTPKLMIIDPTFSANFIHIGLYYASARLRSAMQLTEDSVQYIDVDLSSCPESVKALDYKVINPLNHADPFDKARSSGGWVERPGPGDTVIREWKFGPYGPNAPIPLRYILEDFAPPAPLFSYSPTGSLLATDELAERVLRAGITDVGFLEITSDGTQKYPRWKTLK